MAFSQTHFRSISLPSRLHPINSTNLESELQKLKSCHQITSHSKALPISSEAIQSGLLALAELYNSVDELIQSTSTQNSLDGKSLNQSLEGSVELLDSCNTIREMLQMIKENVQSFQSALRRKGLDSSIQNDIASYFCLRKKMNKTISKSLRKLKHCENSFGEADVLKEVMGVNVSIFKSIFLFFSMQGSGGWSLVSKLMLAKSGLASGFVNEVANVDLALSSFQGRIRSNGAKILDLQMVQKSLHNLEFCIEEFEAGSERLFRQLLRTRVSLLNILTDH